MTEGRVTDMSNAQQQADLPSGVGVLGGGRMGAGIAHAFLIKGARVVIVERDQASAQSALDRVTSSVSQSLERGSVEGTAKGLMSLFSVSVDRSVLEGCQLVIEALPEDLRLKVASLQEVEKHLNSGAVLATNTSSLSVSELAEQLTRPKDFIGLHFFNPVPASTLIEVVVGSGTAPELVARARDWVQALGKTAIVVNDAPGFASSRLGVALALEAMRMVEEGVAEPHDIDTAMILGYKHPTGPLRTTDVVGLDVRLGIAEYLYEKLGDRFAPPQILRDKVARGELGRKTGKGFFTWD
jgi:3-hydroxybutyryl-CoA dehydrogenase